MNGITTTAAILLALAAYTLLANPGGTEPLSTTAPAGCTGDHVCGDDRSVAATRLSGRSENLRSLPVVGLEAPYAAKQ